MSQTTDDLRVGGAPAKAPPRGAVIGALVAVLVVAARGRRRRVLAARRRRGRGRRGRPLAVTGGAAASPALRLSRLGDVEVHRGETATIRYRLIGPSGAAASVTLIVTDAAGQQVKARRLTDARRAGEWLEAAVPIDLEPGRYTYELRLGTAAAPPTPAHHRALRPEPGDRHSASAAL